MTAREFNFDGIVGPTHNYSGLSYGNVASATHQHLASSPRQAALQGLKKMKFVAELGIGQCVLPPLHRPQLGFLRHIGFTGNDEQLIQKAYECDPVLLAVCYSASNMWTANAATVSPSSDCHDGRLHLTPANLASTLHRSLEAPATTHVLRTIFHDESLFAVHDPLPGTMVLTDEGAANHTRLASAHSQAGIEMFVFGQVAMNRTISGPQKYPARQTREASQAIARRHGLDKSKTIYLQQNPRAIDAGVFHNDVISVGNQNVLLAHQQAFVDQAESLSKLRRAFEQNFDSQLHVVEFLNDEISLTDTVNSYLFNSQLLTRPDGGMTLVCPRDCQETPAAIACTKRLVSEDNPVDQVEFSELRQSMNNGGGPACLRLRVVLNEAQQRAMHPGVILTEELFDSLVSWIEKHYREEIRPDDLRDPKLLVETRDATAALCGILDLPTETLLCD